MFFNKSSFPEKANYFSGEMLNEINEPTIGEELNGKGEISFHQLKATNDENVFAVEVKLENKIIDFYCYLVKQENNWKINTIRRFLLPQFVYTVRDSLSNLNSLSSNDSSFYLSLKLFTMADAELKNYLTTNLNKFQELVVAFNNNLKDKADKLLGSVGCNAIYTDKKYPGCVFIQILTFENMEAGFIQAADAILLPQISVEDFVYIEEVTEGWFVFRTI
ncbi:MAG: hypothetical protein U5J96_11190 [Ignavibacteriaceae bacterium]|nr:hypothetical protein [Ignavibacteriaceae bacterium]